MTIRTWSGAAATLGALGTLAVTFACSNSSTPPPPAGTSGQCATSPGQFPASNCAPFAAGTQHCAAKASSCSAAPCSASSACLAMADNSGSPIASLRMRKLLVTAPPALAFQPPRVFVQEVVVDEGINLASQCGEPGTGTFNWLIQVDLSKKTFTTGGGPPTTDPFGAGYCFVDTMIDGLPIKPVTATLTPNADGSYTSSTVDKLYVPIFVAAGTTGAGNAPSVIVLPLTKAQVRNVTLSSDGNCIGHFNADGVGSPMSDGTCSDYNESTCERWTTGGSLGGFITLDEADNVDVPQLSESLCVLLDATAPIDMSNPNEKRCQKDGSGHVLAKGDFCSTTNSPGGCADSYWLAATFAASAAKISATPNQPTCMGGAIDGGAPEGGTEAGSPADAGGQ